MKKRILIDLQKREVDFFDLTNKINRTETKTVIESLIENHVDNALNNNSELKEKFENYQKLVSNE